MIRIILSISLLSLGSYWMGVNFGTAPDTHHWWLSVFPIVLAAAILDGGKK